MYYIFRSRNPRLLYISSSTTTSTLTTNTVCFVTTDAAATACAGKKKRRAILLDGEKDMEMDKSDIIPTRITRSVMSIRDKLRLS